LKLVNQIMKMEVPSKRQTPKIIKIKLKENKLQETLKSKQIEIKTMRIKPKTNTKWRTQLIF
jgi:hypothetical protein